MTFETNSGSMSLHELSGGPVAIKTGLGRYANWFEVKQGDFSTIVFFEDSAVFAAKLRKAADELDPPLQPKEPSDEMP